eukprot:4870948-Prymnesium_polylepis.1
MDPTQVIHAANLDPNMLGTVSRKLDDVLDAKNGAIKDLQYELARITKAHNDVIRVYESKLTEFGIPVEELGFRPLVTSTGTGPAGLVVGHAMRCRFPSRAMTVEIAAEKNTRDDWSSEESLPSWLFAGA